MMHTITCKFWDERLNADGSTDFHGFFDTVINFWCTDTTDQRLSKSAWKFAENTIEKWDEEGLVKLRGLTEITLDSIEGRGMMSVDFHKYPTYEEDWT